MPKSKRKFYEQSSLEDQSGLGTQEAPLTECSFEDQLGFETQEVPLAEVGRPVGA